MGPNGVDCRQATKDNPQRIPCLCDVSGEVCMSPLTRTVSTVALSAATLVLTFGVRGVDLGAQVANNPYKVNYNWDKLEGRKIGVASGIRPDPDGKHLWILDRCGANGCAESDLDPIIQV